MSKKRKYTNPDQPDQLEEYSIMQREITERVQAIGLTARFPIQGDRSYDVEADGTLRMVYAGCNRATNTWRKREWDYFHLDCRNRLWERLAKFAAKHQPAGE